MYNTVRVRHTLVGFPPPVSTLFVAHATQPYLVGMVMMTMMMVMVMVMIYQTGYLIRYEKLITQANIY